MASSEYAPGDVVLTKYGVAAITNLIFDSEGESDGDGPQTPRYFRGRIWRVPGKSIASSASCFLQFDTIMKRLPAAPGMTTNALILDSDKNMKNSCKVLVQCYSPKRDVFVVSLVEEEDEPKKELMELKTNEVEAAKCAKFYPLMEDLMRRGDAVARSSSSFFNKSNVDYLASKSTELLQKAGTTSQEVLSEDNVGALSGTIQNSIETFIPKQEEIQQVYKMMKDEELTDLLKKGQDRLRQLISNDIPQATEAVLSETGITISSSSASSSISESTVALSRENALSALDTLLSEHANTNVEELQVLLNNQFSTVFDSLSTAATSDRYLTSIFDSLNEKTSEWQQATGRLLSTKSASLFLEGTQRLQARAATIFSPEDLFRAKEASNQLSKAFTEGDAALARIKSIELGDAVRSRLISAIELRSGSKGGLDGIIAEALNSVKSGAETSGDEAQKQVQVMLVNMQDTANSVAKNAHESLIEILSQKSQFRDVAVLRIEDVFVNLDSQLDFTSEEIASIARGDGGTAAIFEPIARRAAKEIERQLDAAESYATDNFTKSVLTRVRKLLSGDLTISGVLGEVEAVLNDDDVVAYGKNLVMQGERVLDLFENASGNAYVGDVMGLAEKAGLTKDAIIGTVENLDINKVMDAAEAAVTDEQARAEMLSNAADSALDFLLDILPSLPVPPLDGVKDGMLYHLSNLSMEGFKVKKEDIIVEIAGIRASKTDAKETSSEDCSPNTLNLDSKGDILLENESANDRVSKIESVADPLVSDGDRPVNSTELLIIDIRNISAIMENVIWNFEQTYFPYLKGNGTAYAELFDGSIRLNFELRRRRVTVSNDSSNDSTTEDSWEPVLCLHERLCEIDEVNLRLEGGGKVTWFLNKLATYFKGALRTYVVRSILSMIGNQSGVLLQMLNESLKDYWSIILRTASLSLDDLAEVSEEDLIEAIEETNNDIELVWREHLPLGMNLLMNDDSGLIKVVDFPRGSQARSVVDLKQLDSDVFKGATITGVNGTRYDADTQDQLVEALKDPGRPKTVSFELANPEDAARIRNLVAGFVKNEEVLEEAESDEKSLVIKNIVIAEDGPIGINFAVSQDDVGLVVESYSKGENGETLFAENENDVSIGDLLVSINEQYVIGENGSGRKRAVELFEKQGLVRPLSLSFIKSYFYLGVLDKAVLGEIDPSNELILEENDQHRVLLRNVKSIPGKAEKDGVLIGDHLIYINEVPVGAGCRLSNKAGPRHRLEETLALLEHLGSFSIQLTFARPSITETRRHYTLTNETSTIFTIHINNIEELGCEFSRGTDTDEVIVSNFKLVEGPIKFLKDDWVNKTGLAIESVDGQLVPSFASAKMVLNAITNAFTSKGRVEILFCEDELRNQLNELVS